MIATEVDLVTVPAAAVAMSIPLDALRLKVRREEARLLELGLLVKASGHRLLRAGRLEELRTALGLT